MPEPNLWIVAGIIAGSFFVWLAADHFIGKIVGNRIHVEERGIDSPLFTQADIDALDRAIKKGSRSIVFADHSVTFPSTAEMIKLRPLFHRRLRTDEEERDDDDS